ncbi:MAG: 4-hydroxythreonine-4-phosphate dehydrogenase PdxA [Vitreoscilla sp.]|nr:4-hydroxythreonine-4-phosphate dehydrogenase PdxA [Burkholderiales bacterium]MBP6336836.1 4-hydroxythreonine-4-phosphate dehydrogenase PdxA [Vitreoscilla sp.]MBP6674066.1 4-hydroxythreonine-4-phosphate dehydrogenase PdxA [Vitreoscilla sp.]
MNQAANRAPLLLTMGDPCGIGPEIVAKAFAQGQLQDTVVVADPQVMRRAQAAIGKTGPVVVLPSLADARGVPPGCLSVWPAPGLPPGLAELPWGQVHAQAGAGAAACIEAATRAVLRGEASGLITAPLHKEALAAAGVKYPGHTEMLQALAAEFVGRPLPVRMMLANDELRVVLVTIHVALRKAIDMLSRPLIEETLHITDAALRRFGIAQPRIAVAGLNPHAGEGGLFGDEEVQLIAPAIAAVRAAGLDVHGPYAPDTVFMRARHAANHPGEFDAVVAMTHDHGLIPVKYLGVEQGVNVTLGLPLVRTSPDHGTAFDLAGTGRADPSSLVAALHMARRLVVGHAG